MDSPIKLPEDMEAYLKRRKKYFVVKRGMDILFSIVALIVLSPIFLVVAIAVKSESKGKVIYAQLRTGKDRKPFIMYKFRSMYEGAETKRADLSHKNEMDGPVFKISNDPRVTRLGRFIRKYSLDELPQFVNVLHGEMSIVGPRPLVVYETEKFSDYENMRHLIKPGLTCFWQIGGRSKLSFQELISMDLKYIMKMGIITDFIIILKTVKVVVLKEGAY